jgi:hypothetical protein
MVISEKIARQELNPRKNFSFDFHPDDRETTVTRTGVDGEIAQEEELKPTLRPCKHR